MKDGTVGITFKETMAGGFSMGASDPEEGGRRGKAEGTILSLHADVAIEDLRRFTSEPAHAGRLSGRVEFAPFGAPIPGRDGVFNLFSPTDQPNLKLMVYELGFEREGKSYYLAGKKEVRRDSAFDLWSDTTTLLTRLHQGRDKSGPVVGAGILTLGPGDLVKLAGTIRATNARDIVETTAAIAEFTRFFLGELADSYLKPGPPEEPRRPGPGA
ncbi:MAG: hypothetical protein M3S32_07970 [Acidobacteriota bacterium]|nr:hypothetical protein [Acidobacteriota bacterium]